MSRFVLVGLAAALVAAPAALALDEGQTKALVRVAVRLSGLSATEPVRIVVERPSRFRKHRLTLLDRDYPRAAQNHDEEVYRALGLAPARKGALRKTLLELDDGGGLYDPDSKTGYVRAGAGERTAGLREAVHALEDQHFHLARIRSLRGGDDARIAASAAIEGYATLVTHALPRRDPAVLNGAKLRRFLELKRGFVDSVGLRFVADVRNLGGTKAAIGSLRRFPATSEQVFHLDKYLKREPAAPIGLPAGAAGMTLKAAATFGELDVRALLAVFGIPRLDQVASGWGGGRTVRYAGPDGEAAAIVLAWDTELDARQWAEAVSLYVNEAFDAAAPGLPATSTCNSTTCWQLGPRALAFDRSARLTALVIAVDPATADTLARALTARG